MTWRELAVKVCGEGPGGEGRRNKTKLEKKKEKGKKEKRGEEGKKRRGEGAEKVRRGRAVNNIASIYVFMRIAAEKSDLVALVHLLLPMLCFLLPGLSAVSPRKLQTERDLEYEGASGQA